MGHQLFFICLTHIFIAFVFASNEEVIYKAASVLSLNGQWLAYNNNGSEYLQLQKMIFFINNFYGKVYLETISF